MILLDTNVLSEVRKRREDRADPRVAAWMRDQSDDALFISVICVLEVRLGVLRAEHRDLPHATALSAWLEDQVLPAFAGRILPIGVAIARRAAELHAPRSRPHHDMLIAATVLHHDLTLATRNTRDFADTGVRLINPWDYRVGTGSAPE